MDAEQAGEDRGGDLGGEGEQGSGPGLAGVQADILQAAPEAVVADGLAGASAGEQPWRGAGAADGGVALPAGEALADEARQRVRGDDRGSGQHDLYTGAA